MLLLLYLSLSLSLSRRGPLRVVEVYVFFLRCYPSVRPSETTSPSIQSKLRSKPQSKE